VINGQDIIEVGIDRSTPFTSNATLYLSSNLDDELSLEMKKGMNLFDSVVFINKRQFCKLSQKREVYLGKNFIGKIKNPVNIFSSEKYFLETENGNRYSLVLEKTKKLSFWIKFKLYKVDVEVARIQYRYKMPFVSKGGSVLCQIFDKSDLGISLAFMIFVWADACAVDNSVSA